MTRNNAATKTSVSRSHDSHETDADRMLKLRCAAASAAVLVLRGRPTTGQTDRWTGRSRETVQTDALRL